MWRLGRPLPAGEGRVTQGFGERPEWYARWQMEGHNGLDYACPAGTPVLAAMDGVLEVGEDPEGYGKYARVVNGYGVTIYAHLLQVVLYDRAVVRRGQVIGLSGSTGASTGPHLHFGVKWAGGANPAYRGWVDPVPFRR